MRHNMDPVDNTLSDICRLTFVYGGVICIQIILIAKLVFYSISWWCHDMEMLYASLSLWEENPLITGGFPSQKASNAELWCFIRCSPDYSAEQTVELLVIWDVLTFVGLL